MLCIVLIHFDIVNNNANSVNHLIDCDNSNCFISLYESTEQYRATSIVRMDLYGTETARISDVSFDEFEIQFISQLYEEGDEIIVFANATVSGEPQFITFSISKSFDSYNLIDQIDLGDKYLATVGFQYDVISDAYETFGVTRDNDSNQFLDHFYISIGRDGSINSYQELDLQENPRLITAFARIDSEYRYITYDDSKSMVVDSEFNIVAKGSQMYSIEADGVLDSFLFKSYFAAMYNGKLVTAGTGAANTEYASSISIVDISNDTIVLDTLLPIIDPGIYDDIISVNTYLDYNNNLITSSVGDINGFIAIDENTLYIDKFDDQLQQLWSLDTTTEYELISYQIHVSENSTIYIGGNYRGSDQIGIRNNFLIIVSDEGDIISSNLDIKGFDQVTVYPNPTSGEVYIDGIENLETPYSIYNIDSKLVSSGKLNEISLRGYPKGIYTLRFDGISKRIVLQ